MEAVQSRNETEQRLYQASLIGDVNSLNQLMKEDPLTLARCCITCFNETPLHVAATLGHLDFVKSLLRYKPDLAVEQNSQGFSPLHLVAANGYVEIVKVLVEVTSDPCLVRDEDGNTPLHLAVIKGRVDVVKELIQARLEGIRYTVDRGQTVLHLAAMPNRIEVLKMLVEFGGGDDFVNVEDVDGDTVLHTAVSLKQVETVRYLLDNTRMKVNNVNKNGFAALDIVDSMPRDLRAMEIRECLLNAGALKASKLPTSSAISEKSEPVERDGPATRKVAPTFSPIVNKKNKRGEHWMEKSRGYLMMAATLIAAITYQTAVSPPGGFWDRNSTANDSYTFRAGTARWAAANITEYCIFYVRNTVAFLAALSIMFLLVSGFYLRRKIFNYILMAIMWATIISMALSYMSLVLDVGGSEMSYETDLVFTFLGVAIMAWLALIGIVFVVQCIRVIVSIVRNSQTTQSNSRGNST